MRLSRFLVSVGVSKRRLLLSVVSVGLLATVSGTPAHAQLIVSDWFTGATQGVSADDSWTTIALNNPLLFYGTSYSTLFMGTNGFLSTTAASTYINTDFPIGTGMIAPLWDDWRTDGAGRMWFRQDSDKLVATWSGRHFGDNSVSSLFQAVVYNNGTIGFGYDAIDTQFGVTAGLNAGDGRFIQLDTPTSNSQAFFTYNSVTGNYTMTGVSSAPEPGTLALALPLLAGVVGMAKRRQK